MSGQHQPDRCPASWHRGCAAQCASAVGPHVGDVVGDVVGASLGASVFSQQYENIPRVSGQHQPDRCPASWHRGCAAQCASEVGDLEGTALGDALGNALGLDVGHALGDSEGTSEGLADGTYVGLPDGSKLGDRVLSQQNRNTLAPRTPSGPRAPSVGQHTPRTRPIDAQLGCKLQSAWTVGSFVGLGDGNVVGTAVGVFVLLQHQVYMPVSLGQHSPVVSPNSAHIGFCAHAAGFVGALVGDGVGISDGDVVGEEEGDAEGNHVGLAVKGLSHSPPSTSRMTNGKRASSPSNSGVRSMRSDVR